MSTPTSSVSAVTVFRRGAMVTRIADVPADAGRFPERVHLTGLPLTLDDESLRIELAAVDGDTGVLPVAGDVEVTVAVPEVDARLPPAVDAELEDARREHARARRELHDLEQALARNDALAIAPRGEPEEGKPPTPSPTAARLALLTLRRARADTLHERIAAAKIRARELHERLATLEERARIASDARNARRSEIRKAAVIRLAVPATADPIASRVRLRVSYFVSGARWAPAYTLRLDRELQRGTLELRALVGQSSGEDWTGVALTLSTASAQRWTELPELQTVRIGRAQPPIAKTGWRPAPAGASSLYADYDRDLARVPPPAPLAAAADLERLATLAAVLDADEETAAQAVHRPQPAPPRPSSFAAPKSAMAPPMPRAPAPGPGMPMPVAMPAPARTRSSGLGSMVGNALGGIAGGVTAVFGSSAPEGGAAHAAEHEDLPPPSDTGVVAGRALLDYGRLRLPAADDPRRGSLHRAPPGALRDEAARASIRAAGFAAEALEERDPPAGFCWPIEEDGFAHVYLADAPVDIASDGKLASVPVLARDIESVPRYVCVPRESPDVFRLVALRNPLAAPILAGPVDVYVAGRFSLGSDLRTTPTDGRIELGLGVEQAIKIARNVTFEEDTSGLIKRQHALMHTIRIEIANHSPRLAHVEIRERLPVAAEDQQDDIDIELVEVEPSWEEYEQKPEPLEGGRIWKVEVEAGAERELKAVWVAKIPSQHELVGGNRRES